mgnify:CR=1 FL=1
MSKFHAIYGNGGSSSGGNVTKLVKSISIGSSDLNNITIDISNDVSNYNSITNDNIIIEFTDIASKAAAVAKLNHTYNADTGIITITSSSNDLPFASTSETTLNLNVFLAGEVVIPPVKPITGYKVSEGYASINATSIKDLITGNAINATLNSKTIIGAKDDIIIATYAVRASGGADVGIPYNSITNAVSMIPNDDKTYIPLLGIGDNDEAGGYSSIAILKSADGNVFTVTGKLCGGGWNSGSLIKLTPEE